LNSKIYIVEDDTDIAELIDFNLGMAGYDTKVFNNGDDAYEAIIDSPPDLLLLDLSLPGLSGIEIAKYIRSSPEVKELPIIMLTARSEETDKVIGLKTGADDYVTKPFSIKELLARIEAILRRTKSNYDSIFKSDLLTVDFSSHSVKCGDKPVSLSRKEFDILKSLIDSKGKVISRLQLVEQVWGNEDAADEHTINVNIKRLRDKLRNCKKMIKTIHGVGYRLSREKT
jgi:two-component system alkaline phosphatase synthesis response regulator PhoP